MHPKKCGAGLFLTHLELAQEEAYVNLAARLISFGKAARYRSVSSVLWAAVTHCDRRAAFFAFLSRVGVVFQGKNVLLGGERIPCSLLMIRFFTMKQNYKRWMCASFGAMMLVFAPRGMAQAVIFPQEEQPGVAALVAESDSYTLQNDLFSARFVKQDGKLMFDGSEGLGLLPGSELFKIQLGDGTEVPASSMTLGEVRTVTLTGDETAVRGSHRFDGQAIEADFSYGKLNLLWRAVLRDGSHYLRTELELTAQSDQPMTSITPMIYVVDNSDGSTAPVVVGNTRGAILASDRLFAGLETPMGINSVGGTSELDDFTHNAWTATSFSWSPGTDLPEGISDLGFGASDVMGTRGYLVFKEAGDNTITFTYQSGTHRLNMVGVDLVDLSGNVVAHDYHVGYTGNQHGQNSYTLNVPEAGTGYLVRYFVETKTETVTSSGTITYDKTVKVPVIVHDGKTGTTSSPAARRSATTYALSGNTIAEDGSLTDSWKPADWQVVENVPLRINELGYYNPDVKSIEQELNIESPKGTLTAEFLYQSGNNGLSIVGVDLVDNSGNVVVSDYHIGFTGNQKENNVYTLGVPYSGQFTLRYFCQNNTEANTSSGTVNLSLAVIDTLHLPAYTSTPIQGVWSRNTTLAAGKTWNVSAVVGLIAPGQARRSVLAYSERERAVPWRPFPCYISWYELNINRNNDPDYTTNMTVEQCENVVSQWNTRLYKRYGVAPKAFVWDDGWDEYGTWTFNKNFPNGFAEPDSAAREMGSGIGAWLGPVGGYGQSGTYRRNYWSNKGGMQLSNPLYYDVFYKACSNMVKSYDFRFFKFDGISAQFSAVGPDAGTTGEENAEAIIDIEREIRKIKPDIFLNTTVGTWASPFWFQFTDAVWRQENDYGEIGNQGTDREKWITYRDRLVYQNFVQNSPLCPINTLMTHGFILTEHGNVSKNMDYKGVVRELRCAFACGSGMVELYNDYKLTTTITGGNLWKEIADCIKWQEENADVLPDIHWVGGNPWDGSKANVYGWASWNGSKATLALRNPSSSQQTYTFTLREALDIPDYVKTSVTLSDAFSQNALKGLSRDEAIDIDTRITVTLPGSTVYVYNGVDHQGGAVGIGNVVARPATPDSDLFRIYDLSGRQRNELQRGVNIVNGQKLYQK